MEAPATDRMVTVYVHVCPDVKSLRPGRCAGHSREILFLTDGGVSGNEEERIMDMAAGKGAKVRPARTATAAPRCDCPPACWLRAALAFRG